MPPKTVSDAQLRDRLIEVFRAEGYEGTSLSRLQQATGLQRSSLYHRFPAGKQDMAAAVVQDVARRFAEEILAPEFAADRPEVRLDAIAQRLDEFYDGGHLSCLLDTLSLGRPSARIAQLTRQAVALWVAALREIATDAGLDHDEAHRRAVDAVAAIQGALIVARTIGDTAGFRRALGSLPQRLLS